MLDKSIKHNKEYRKQYRKSKRFDRSCRNHGSCAWCEKNRTIKEITKDKAAKSEIKDYEKR